MHQNRVQSGRDRGLPASLQASVPFYLIPTAAMHQSHMTSSFTCQALSGQSVVHTLVSHLALHRTALCCTTPHCTLLGSFPLAAGTNCEREVDRLARWSACLTVVGRQRPRSSRPCPFYCILSSVNQSLMAFWSSTRPGQGGSRPIQSHLGGNLTNSSCIASLRIASHRNPGSC